MRLIEEAVARGRTHGEQQWTSATPLPLCYRHPQVYPHYCRPLLRCLPAGLRERMEAPAARSTPKIEVASTPKHQVAGTYIMRDER
jgi:hypothetical protein